MLTVSDLHVSYGAISALGGISFTIEAGSIVTLIGGNGAGKTTTLRMLMGMLAPTAGWARIEGLDCFEHRAEVMASVGYLPDEPLFQEHLTGGEIVRFCGAMRGLEDKRVRRRTASLAQRLGFEDALDEYAVNYSMGMRKKLALCCALLHEPTVLILDEPTNGLDPKVTRSLLELVREEAARGTTVLYSTHLIDQAERLCTRVGIIDQGRLVAVGTPAELRTAYAPADSLEGVFFAATGAPLTQPERAHQEPTTHAGASAAPAPGAHQP